MLAFGTQIRGFKPGQSHQIFQGEKILSTPSFGREVKLFVPCRRFMECKRSLNVTWKSGIFRKNSSAISHPSSSSFHYYSLWCRHLAVQVGTTKDKGLYNKPSAAVHPGALATRTLPQYNTMLGHWNTSLIHYSPTVFITKLYRTKFPCISAFISGRYHYIFTFVEHIFITVSHI